MRNVSRATISMRERIVSECAELLHLQRRHGEVNVTRPETRDHDSDKHVAKYSAISCTNTRRGPSPSVCFELFNAHSILLLFSYGGNASAVVATAAIVKRFAPTLNVRQSVRLNFPLMYRTANKVSNKLCLITKVDTDYKIKIKLKRKTFT